MVRPRAYLSLSAFVLSACFELTTFGNGHRDHEERDISRFSRVENRTDLDVEVLQSDSFFVEVRVDSNVLDHVETRLVGNTLVIDSDRRLESLVHGPHVRVTMPHLVAGTQSGSGSLTFSSFSEPGAVDLRVSGSGDLEFDGQAADVSVSIEGSGALSLSGSADNLDATVSGSGELDAEPFPVSAATLSVEGSGDVRARINGTVDVTIDGSGDVDLYGKYEITNTSTPGSGALHQH